MAYLDGDRPWLHVIMTTHVVLRNDDGSGRSAQRADARNLSPNECARDCPTTPGVRGEPATDGNGALPGLVQVRGGYAVAVARPVPATPAGSGAGRLPEEPPWSRRCRHGPVSGLCGRCRDRARGRDGRFRAPAVTFVLDYFGLDRDGNDADWSSGQRRSSIRDGTDLDHHRVLSEPALSAPRPSGRA